MDVGICVGMYARKGAWTQNTRCARRGQPGMHSGLCVLVPQLEVTILFWSFLFGELDKHLSRAMTRDAGYVQIITQSE
jgi:hypothetical protein